MAKKRIPEVPRDGSEVDFIPENFMLIDGAEGSAKMRMDLFGKASAIEELDEVKYEKPEDGIPKTDLAEGVQGSLGLADTALQAPDIEGKANKSEMSISAVTGDVTKKNIQLRNSLSQTVVIEHQNIDGKANTSEMSITDVSGDTTKKTIQLKSGLSQDVVVEHQNIDGKVDANDMRITAVSGDDTKKTIQLRTGLSQDVVVEHQNIDDKVGRSEMAVTDVTGDATKKTICLNAQLSQDVVVDVTGKANKAELSITDVSGDATKKTIQLKSGVSQDVVVDISGKADAEDVLTTWTRARSNPSQVTGTLSLNSTIDPTRIEVNLDDTIAGDLLVGHLVPTVINDDRGKVLMVTPSTGIAWQPVQHTLSVPSSTAGVYDTMQGIIAFQTDNAPRRTSAYLTFASGDPECLGMLVPPVKREDAGRFLTVDETDGAVWRDLPRAETEWDHLNPYTQEFGVLKFVTSFNEEEPNVWVNHHTSAYIGTVDVSGWVGEFLPHYETSDSGKILMVSPTNGPEWTNMPEPDIKTTWNYGDSETRQGTLSVGTTFESDAPHHSSAYIEYNSSTTWLGAFVPPTDTGDIGKALMVDATRGVEWKNIPDPDIETLMPDRWKTLLNSAANAVGDHLHHTFIGVDSNGNAKFGRAERLFWEWTFRNPSVIATSDDISNGYVDFVFPLGETGMRIGENGNLITIKGFDIPMGNILNGKQLTFLLRGSSGSPTIILDSGFSTYTESVVNNYQWKAFKSFGLTSDRNVSYFNAVLRVPIASSTEPGTEIEFDANITVSMFGVASNDTIS